jgi:hypothetical protein
MIIFGIESMFLLNMDKYPCLQQMNICATNGTDEYLRYTSGRTKTKALPRWAVPLRGIKIRKKDSIS